MVDTSEIDGFDTEFDNKVNYLLQRMLEEGYKMVPDMKTDAYLEYAEYQHRIVTDLFIEAVDEFYQSYDALYYDRTWSLYNALELNPENEYGMLNDIPTDEELYNPSNVSEFREGGGSEGLFDLVFMHGWHGGAVGTDHHGISVTSPTYRTPYPQYGRWGRPAFKTESPHDIVLRKINENSSVMDDKFRSIVTYHAEKLAARWQARTDELVSEIFGDWR